MKLVWSLSCQQTSVIIVTARNVFIICYVTKVETGFIWRHKNVLQRELHFCFCDVRGRFRATDKFSVFIVDFDHLLLRRWRVVGVKRDIGFVEQSCRPFLRSFAARHGSQLLRHVNQEWRAWNEEGCVWPKIESIILVVVIDYIVMIMACVIIKSIEPSPSLIP